MWNLGKIIIFKHFIGNNFTLLKTIAHQTLLLLGNINTIINLTTHLYNNICLIYYYQIYTLSLMLLLSFLGIE